MRLCRFDDDRLGVVDGDFVRDVTAALDTLPPARYGRHRGDPMIAALPALAGRIAALQRDAPRRPLSSLRLLSPVAAPGKIVAAPVNYRKHLDEARADPGIHHSKQIADIQSAGLFLKATSALVGPGEGVAIRHLDRRNDHEIELVAVIGSQGSDIPAAGALEHVAGYCVGLDMTVRGPEERSLRKSIDSFAVLGPCLATADEIADPGSLDLLLTVNGEVRQQANTRDLILPIAQLIEFASSFYTLYPGDLLFTGTPEGVGRVVPGDVMVASVSGIGRMEVAVRSAK